MCLIRDSSFLLLCFTISGSLFDRDFESSGVCMAAFLRLPANGERRVFDAQGYRHLFLNMS